MVELNGEAFGGLAAQERAAGLHVVMSGMSGMREEVQQSSTRRPEEGESGFEPDWSEFTPANRSFGGSREIPVINQMRRQSSLDGVADLR